MSKNNKQQSHEVEPTGNLQLRCFSSTVMLFTFVIEIMLATYSLIFRKKSIVTLLGALIVVFLAVFQLAEYAICETYGWSGDIWARIGFVCITTLPVLGLHMITEIAGKTRQYKWLVILSYTIGISWALGFVFAGVLQNNTCGGNYIITSMRAPFGGTYLIHYYVWLLIGMFVALRESYKTKNKYVIYSLSSIVVGYVAFMLPATLIHVFIENATTGLPSIMCGFAVILAIIISTYTLRKTDKL